MTLTMDIPEHLCECGCGQTTEIAPRTNLKRGMVKGRANRFVRGHFMNIYHQQTRESPADLPAISENDVKKVCMDWLATIPAIDVWRMNTGGMSASYGGKKRFIKFGPTGQSDIQGIGPSGVFLAIELKRPGEKPSDSQTDYLNKINKFGGIGFYCDSVEMCCVMLRMAFQSRGFDWRLSWDI